MVYFYAFLPHLLLRLGSLSHKTIPHQRWGIVLYRRDSNPEWACGVKKMCRWHIFSRKVRSSYAARTLDFAKQKRFLFNEINPLRDLWNTLRVWNIATQCEMPAGAYCVEFDAPSVLKSYESFLSNSREPLNKSARTVGKRFPERRSWFVQRFPSIKSIYLLKTTVLTSIIKAV